MNNSPKCETIQLSISDALDENKQLSKVDLKHISQCSECAEFHTLWSNNSPIISIAAGSLIEQENLTNPIISKLEKKYIVTLNNKFTHRKFLKIASIAAIITVLTTISSIMIKPNAIDRKEQQITIIKSIETQSAAEKLEQKIMQIRHSLSQTEVEKSLQRNYMRISKSATNQWKTAKMNISLLKEFISHQTTKLMTFKTS